MRLLLLLLVPSLALAQVPNKLGYQGRLLNADGTPASGSKTVTFFIADAANGGQTLWTEDQILALSDGYYATFLGSVTAFPAGLFDGSARYVGVKIGGSELSPRQEVGSVAYAIQAGQARDVVGGTVNASSITVANGGTLKVGSTTVIDASGQVPSASLGAHTHATSDITSGTMALARLPTGTGNGLDADLVDGEHAASLHDFSKLTGIPAGLTNPAAGAAAAIISQVVVSAKADVCPTPAPAPHFDLYVNGRIVGGKDVTNASAYQPFTIAVAPSRYASEVAVVFTSDWNNGTCDVNLYVEKITLTTAAGNITILATDSAHAIYDVGNTYFDFFDNVDVRAATSTLAWNGALRFLVSPNLGGSQPIISCSRVKFTAPMTYTDPTAGLNAKLDIDPSGASVCGAGWHVCNYQEVTIYGMLGGCEPTSYSWIVGGFSNTEGHRRSFWSSQGGTQCLTGDYPIWYGPWPPYKGRVHCNGGTASAPVSCCMNY